MAKRVKAVSGVLYALGVAAALMFGAQQVWASSTSVSCRCTIPFEWGECSFSCCPDAGMCSSQLSCICV